MGYESKFYIVDKNPLYSIDEETGLRYAELIAHFDLSKVYEVSDKVREYPPTSVCFCTSDGNHVIKDCYGERLKEVPIPDLISIVEGAMLKDDGHYRRYAPFLAMLKGFNLKQWDNLVALHYGY